MEIMNDIAAYDIAVYDGFRENRNVAAYIPAAAPDIVRFQAETCDSDDCAPLDLDMPRPPGEISNAFIQAGAAKVVAAAKDYDARQAALRQKVIEDKEKRDMAEIESLGILGIYRKMTALEDIADRNRRAIKFLSDGDSDSAWKTLNGFHGY